MDPEALMDEVRTLYGAERSGEFQAEESSLRILMPLLIRDLSARYEIVRPFDIGGIGLLFLLKDLFSGRERALKLSRPLAGREEFATNAVQEEGRKLMGLVHPRLIPVHEVGLLEKGTTRASYFVMDYLDGATNWLGFVASTLPGQDDQTQRDGTGARFYGPSDVLNAIISTLHDVALGLEFLHSTGFVHFDLKPSNVLIGKDGVARVADLGSAKERTQSPKETAVGFTHAYAHPELFSYEYRKTSDENRLVARIPRERFKFEWDLYALGQSLLQLLGITDKAFPDDAVHLPRFRYLHLMACRMLGGHVRSAKPPFFSEQALGLSASALKETAYRSTREVRVDIEKEIGLFVIESEIPELNVHSRSTIRGAEFSSTTFTQRLKRVLDHPLVSRLSRVSQLGLIRLVYPTASHSRFDHSVGTYANACAYVLALYHDSENPLFRQIISPQDVREVLLASLLHDLGQYPMAHDVEEIYYPFDHKNITLRLFSDERSKSLRDVIEDSKDGWDANVENIREILRARRRRTWSTLEQRAPFKARLLSTIIDGPIDADKTDYLLRDSRECRLNYGEAIDFERLMKTITVAYEPNEDNVSLAVYEKGMPSAESIAFIRYLMFTAVYWHHTTRAYKAMLHQALRILLSSGTGTKWEESLQNGLYEFVQDFEFKAKKMGRSLLDELEKGPKKPSIAESDLALLAWLYDRAPDGARELLSDLATRDLYKRLVSVHFQSQSTGPSQKLWELFQQTERKPSSHLELCGKLQYVLLTEVRRRRAQNDVRLTEPLTGKQYDEFERQMVREHHSILVDIPRPGEKTGSDIGLRFVKETTQKRYLDDLPEDAHLQFSEVWLQHVSELMKSAAVVRIFCHPKVKAPIRAALSVADIMTLCENVVRGM